MTFLMVTIAHLARPMPWILSGLLMAAGGVYAQETVQKMRQRAEAVKQKHVAGEVYEKLLQQAIELLKRGKPARAYYLLEPLEFEHSGEERFDNLIGIAALDSGKPDKATLAFERILMVNPNSAAARLDMARAYYQLGDILRARNEFETVMKLNPSAAAKSIIQKYREAIAAQETGKQTRITAYVEGTVGRDDNVNNSTSQSQIFVDAPGVYATLDATNVKTADSYYAVAAGGEATRSLNAKWGLYAGADLRQRSNSSQKSFDAQNLDARAGAMLGTQTDRLRVGLLGAHYNLGGSHNSNSSGIRGDWRHMFSPSNQLNAFAQQLQYRYIDLVMQPNDYNQQAIGVGWLHGLASGKSALFGSLYRGKEQDVSAIITQSTPDGGRIDGAKRFNGIRVGMQTEISEKTTLFVNAGEQLADYSKVNSQFLRQRSDRLYDLVVGVSWHWDKLWVLRTQLNYTNNNSNIMIYGFDRTDVSLTIRREFR